MKYGRINKDWDDTYCKKQKITTKEWRNNKLGEINKYLDSAFPQHAGDIGFVHRSHLAGSDLGIINNPLSLGDIADWFRERSNIKYPEGTKSQQQLYCFASFDSTAKGSELTKEQYCNAVSMMVLDFDDAGDVTPDQILSITDCWSILYSSYSHGMIKDGKKYSKYRLIIALDKTIPAVFYSVFMQQFCEYVKQKLGIIADSSCNNPAHYYYYPCHGPYTDAPVYIQKDGPLFKADQWFSKWIAQLPQEDQYIIEPYKDNVINPSTPQSLDGAIERYWALTDGHNKAWFVLGVKIYAAYRDVNIVREKLTELANDPRIQKKRERIRQIPSIIKSIEENTTKPTE